MCEKSIDLCKLSGVDVASVLLEHLSAPESRKLRIGSFTVGRIKATHEPKDGYPVVEAEGVDGSSLTFQFSPDGTNFRDTAINPDGQPVCSDPS